MADRPFTPGTKVWAKVKGYPWWPGTIMKISEVPKELAEYSKANLKKDDFHSVLFFGSYDYALIPSDCIKNLEDDWAEFSAKNGGGKFKLAVEEAKKFIPKTISKQMEADIKEKPQKEPISKQKASTKDSGLEKGLPTNATIVVDPVTGEQTVKKRRGRPPKVRPNDFPPMQIKGEEKKGKQEAFSKPNYLLTAELGVYSRKLQKILLRSEIKPVELPIAVRIIEILFRKRKCTISQLQTSNIGKVLAHAMQRDMATWRPYPEIMEAFNFVLRTWKSLPKYK